MRFFSLVFVLFIVPAVGFSATYYVPTNFTDIQLAINAANNGDTIIVLPGTYVENLDFLGKAITVQSDQGPETTVIDGGQQGSVVVFLNQEGPDSVLDGFTLTNGSGDLSGGTARGGGIYCNLSSSPTIKNNIITLNTADLGGGIYPRENSNPLILNNTISLNSAVNIAGGIYCGRASPDITGNIIYGNTAGNEGGGIMVYLTCSPTIQNNTIMDNSAVEYGGGIEVVDNCTPVIKGNVICGNKVTVNGGGGILIATNSSGIIMNNIIHENTAYFGGGISCLNHASPDIINNTIYDNSADWSGGIDLFDTCSPAITNNTVHGNHASVSGGGIACRNNSDATITNTIIWNNDAMNTPELYLVNSDPDISYCDIMGGWPGTGNIDASPRFVNPAGHDFHLFYDSPCRDAGSATAPGLPGEDHEGDPRNAYGTVDIGADEFHTHLYYTGEAVPGGNVDLKLVGIPGTSPVGLFLAFGKLDPPMKSMWGDWYLTFPCRGPIMLGTMPSPGGVLVLPGALPGSPPGPYSLYLQAILGSELTNLCEMDV